MFGFPVYSLKNLGVSIAGATTVSQYKAGTNGIAILLRNMIGQGNSVTSTQTAATLIRKTAAATVTAGSAGTTVTKNNPVNPTTDASLGVSATGITASAEGTDGEQISTRPFNILNGQESVWTPEERPVVPVSGIVGQKLLAAFTATYYSELTWMEMRGA
jgi:hypothetical protein